MPSNKRIAQIGERLMNDPRGIESASNYGEPGYSLADDKTCILFANWNNFSNREQAFLESVGFELEWSDEWTIDYNNNKAWRTEPTSYFWESSIMYTTDGEVLTPDDDIVHWLDECAMTCNGQPIQCLPSRIAESELQDAGFTLFADRQETGLHSGMNDSPLECAKRAFALPDTLRVVFRKVENSQFYAVWQCWIESETADQSDD